MKFSLIAISLWAFAQIPNTTSQERTPITDGLHGPACQKLSQAVFIATKGACDHKVGKFDCVMSESDNLKLVDVARACNKEIIQTLTNQNEEIGCDNLEWYALNDKPAYDELTKFCTSTKNRIKTAEELLQIKVSEPIKAKRSTQRRDM